MRDYGTVSPKFWTGGTGKRLRPHRDARLLALYLMTSPHSTMTGVYHVPVAYMSADTGIPFEGASEALDLLCKEGFCDYDKELEWVFVRTMAEWQVAPALQPRDNRVAGVQREFDRMPDGWLKDRFFAVYGKAYHLKQSPPYSPFEGASEGASEGPSSQEQEQDQEQNQEQKSSSLNASEREKVLAATKALRQLGMLDVHPSRPELIQAIQDGATVDQLADTARELRDRPGTEMPNLKYVVATLRGRAKDQINGGGSGQINGDNGSAGAGGRRQGTRAESASERAEREYWAAQAREAGMAEDADAR